MRHTPDSIVYHDYKFRFGQRKIFYQERNRYLMLLKIVLGSFIVIYLFSCWPRSSPGRLCLCVAAISGART